MDGDRVILHCDCNNFFASVELRTRPDLKDIPVAVAGDTDNRHGIILAKNMIANVTYYDTKSLKSALEEDNPTKARVLWSQFDITF